MAARITLALSLCVSFSLLIPVSHSHASAQDYSRLMDALADKKKDFRVRIQAAYALGKRQHGPARGVLERALRDSHPAIRAAAATALGRLGDKRSIRALRRAERDRERAVQLQAQRAIEQIENRSLATSRGGRGRGGEVYPPIASVPSTRRVQWNRTRFVVTVDKVHAPKGVSRQLQSFAKGELGHGIHGVRGIAVLTDRQASQKQARKQIRRHRIPHFDVKCSIQSLKKKRVGGMVQVRAQVMLTLIEHDGKTIRGSLSGAATAQARISRATRPGENLAQQAVAAAIRSSIASIQPALKRAANR